MRLVPGQGLQRTIGADVFGIRMDLSSSIVVST